MISKRDLFPNIPSPVGAIKDNRGLAKWSLLLIFLEVIRVVGFVSININNIIMVGIMLVPTVFYGLSRGASFISLYIIYFAYLGINILLTDPPALFQSWFRLGLFVSLLLAVSPVLQNRYLRCFRFYCFKYLFLFAVPLAVMSFLGFFAGINFIRSAFVHEITKAGAFGGMFGGSMILGPFSAISSCYAFWVYMTTKKPIWIVIAVMCMGATLFSASRSAVYGGVLGCVAVVYYGNKSRSKSLSNLFAVVIAGALTFPIWQGALSGINQKNEASKAMGEYGTRTEKFEARIHEIESSPVLGIGFAAIDLNGGDAYDPRTGVVEPGSSWLAYLSMTGIVGCAFMVIIYMSAFLSAIRSASRYGGLLAGLILFFAFHQLFEGYALAAGSVLCFIFWLIIGVATDMKYEAS